MALTLRAAINASQTTIDVLGSDDISEGSIYSVGSEYLLVSTVVSPQRPYLDPLHRLLTVYRGVQGTPKAAHAASAGLTAVLPGAGGGGVTVDNGVDAPAAVTTLVAAGAVIAGSSATLPLALQFRLIGPFHIAFNTPGLVNPANNGLEIGDIPAGSIFVRPIVIPTVGWDGWITGDEVDVAIGSSAGDARVLFGIQVDRMNVVESTPDFAVDPLPLADMSGGAGIPWIKTAIALNDTHVVVSMFPNGDLTAGEADIYAIIATPAA